MYFDILVQTLRFNIAAASCFIFQIRQCYVNNKKSNEHRVIKTRSSTDISVFLCGSVLNLFRHFINDITLVFCVHFLCIRMIFYHFIIFYRWTFILISCYAVMSAKTVFAEEDTRNILLVYVFSINTFAVFIQGNRIKKYQ
jgi:hypothetical protein